jgi:hypothetical protein
MIYLAWAAGLFLLFIIFAVNRSLVISVELMSQPEGLIEPVVQIDDAGFALQFTLFDAWANQHGFVHDKFFLGHTLIDGSDLLCSAWWNEQNAIWVLSYYSKGKQIYDFVSKLSNGTDITTASSKDAHTLPNPPHKLIQSFADTSFDTLFEKHQATLKLLQSKSIGVDMQKTDVIQEVKSSLARQMAYIKTLPFWKYRGVYWYFIRRNLLVNKPIK